MRTTNENRDTALDFTARELGMWSSTTQAIALIKDAHFDLFNLVESGKLSKAKARRSRAALESLYRAAKYLRSTASPGSEAYWNSVH